MRDTKSATRWRGASVLAWWIALLLALAATGCKDSPSNGASVPQASGGAAGSGDGGGSGGEAGAEPDGGTAGDAGVGGGAGNDGGTALPAPEPDPDAAARIAAVLVASCGPQSTAAAIEALARAGIETYDDDSGELLMQVLPPARGLRVTRTQARGMGCELANRGGTTGAQFDHMVGPLPLPNGEQLPFSALLAAYPSTNGPFGSQLAAALMGPVDTTRYATLVYPSIVVTTFLREVVVPMLALATPSGFNASAAGGMMLREGADPCGAISKFLNDLPGAVSKAVNSLSPEEGGFWSMVVSGASIAAGIVTYAAVEAAKTFVQHLPGMDALRSAATAVGAVVDLRSMFTQWEIKITAQPPKVHKSVGSTNMGDLVLQIAPPEQGLDWPQQVKSCASLLNIPLPQLNSAEGAAVVWTPLAGFPSPAKRVSDDAPIAGNQAKLTFETVQEDPAIHNGGGALKTTPAQVRADIALPGLESLGAKITDLMGSSLATGVLSAGVDKAAQLTGPSATGAGTVEYHDAGAATIDVEISGGGGTFKLHLASCAGVYGPYTGDAQVLGDPSGSSDASLSIDPTSKTGPLSLMIPLAGSCSGTYNVNATATLGGTDLSPDVTFVGQVTGSIVCPGGGGPISAPVNGTFPVTLGPAPECP